MTPTVRSVTSVPFTDAVVCRQNGQDDRGCGNETDAEVQAPSPSAVLPYLLALLYRLVGHPRPANWFNPLCLFYSVGAVTSAHIYLLRHPELRPSRKKKARRLAATNPRKATLQVMVFLAVSLAVLSTFLFFDRNPPSNLVFAQGLPRARRVMEHVSRSGMGWCCPHLSGIPPSLSGIGAEEEG